MTEFGLRKEECDGLHEIRCRRETDFAIKSFENHLITLVCLRNFLVNMIFRTPEQIVKMWWFHAAVNFYNGKAPNWSFYACVLHGSCGTLLLFFLFEVFENLKQPVSLSCENTVQCKCFRHAIVSFESKIVLNLKDVFIFYVTQSLWAWKWGKICSDAF